MTDMVPIDYASSAQTPLTVLDFVEVLQDVMSDLFAQGSL